MNELAILRADIEATIQRTAAELHAERMLWLHDFEDQLKPEKKQSLELSSLAIKAKVQHQKDNEHLEAARRSMGDAE